MNMKKKFLIGLVTGLLVFGLIGMANATVLTFEDTEYALYGSDPYDLTFNENYGGLNWSYYFGIFNAPRMGSYGYQNGTVSGDYALFNAYGTSVSVTSDDQFDWNGAWFSSVRDNTDSSVQVWGFRDNVRIYEDTISFNWGDPQWFEANWSDVDEVRFIGSWNSNYTRFAMDDFTFNEAAPVPEPATLLLFSTGLVGLIAAKSRKKKK
jgi:hypothetical protein